MRTVLLSLLIFAHPLLAAPDPSLFGPVEKLQNLDVSLLAAGRSFSLRTWPNKDGTMGYHLTITRRDFSSETLDLTKEDFTKCYILLSRGFHEFHCPHQKGREPRTAPWQLLIMVERSSAKISFYPDCLGENPALREFAIFLDALAK